MPLALEFLLLRLFLLLPLFPTLLLLRLLLPLLFLLPLFLLLLLLLLLARTSGALPIACATAPMSGVHDAPQELSLKKTLRTTSVKGGWVRTASPSICGGKTALAHVLRFDSASHAKMAASVYE